MRNARMCSGQMMCMAGGGGGAADMFCQLAVSQLAKYVVACMRKLNTGTDA